MKEASELEGGERDNRKGLCVGLVGNNEDRP